MNVLYEKREHTALITVDRPDALNALNLDALKELDEAVETAENDDGVYVVIITGAGRSFVAGADVSQMKDFTANEGRAFGSYGNKVFLKIENCSKPVIAAINGFALGGGCELAMACDIRIAGDKARFGQPEVTLGITPGFGGTQRLQRIVGASMAKELIFTGRQIKADEALSIGLVSRVVPGEELMDAAFSLANEIAQNAQVAVRQSKAAINNGMQCGIEAGLSYETQAFALCFSTDDQKNAMAAFVNRTQAEPFKNK